MSATAAKAVVTSSSSGFSSEFFKVFLAENSSTQLRLPPAFTVEGIETRIPKRSATLEDEAGKAWPMAIKREQESDDLLLDDGWPAFVAGHRLVDGDFLIFRYRGNSSFNVEVFGRNGLKKTKKTNVKTKAFTLPNSVKQEQKETEKFPGEIRVKEELPESESSGSDWEQQSLRCRRKRRGCRGGRTTEPPAQKKTTGRNFGSKTEHQELPLKSQFPPERPHFTLKMAKHCAYCVNVPLAVLRAHKIRLEEAITLTNGDDARSRWTAVVTSRLDGRVMINSGWCSFRRENQIMIGDECVFELIVSGGGGDNNSVCSEARVHIRRRTGTPPGHSEWGRNRW